MEKSSSLCEPDSGVVYPGSAHVADPGSQDRGRSPTQCTTAPPTLGSVVRPMIHTDHFPVLPKS